jgi:hypothetical protein
MALSNAELALAQGRQADREGRLRAAPEPRLLPRQISDALNRASGSEHALARLQFEHRQEDELLAELAALRERAIKLDELRQNLQLELDIAGRHGDGHGAPSEQGKKRIGGQLAECAERAAEVTARAGALSARINPYEHRIDRCRKRIIESLRGGDAALRFLPLPVVEKKMNLAAAREAILQLAADMREIAAAPRPLSEVRAEIADWVDRELRPPAVGRLFDPESWEAGVYLPGNQVEGVLLPNSVGFALWLTGRDESIKKLCALAEPLADDAHALSGTQRAEKIAKCKRELLAAERIEEALAWQHLQNGEPIALRADADVRAILSIA